MKVIATIQFLDKNRLYMHTRVANNKISLLFLLKLYKNDILYKITLHVMKETHLHAFASTCSHTH